jgi:hypothetical protein
MLMQGFYVTSERVDRRLTAHVASYSHLMGADEVDTDALKSSVDPGIAANHGRIAILGTA